MPEYIVWHPRAGPEKFSDIIDALYFAVDCIKEYKGVVRNNVIITREDLPRPVRVVYMYGRRIE